MVGVHGMAHQTTLIDFPWVLKTNGMFQALYNFFQYESQMPHVILHDCIGIPHGRCENPLQSRTWWTCMMSPMKQKWVEYETLVSKVRKDTSYFLNRKPIRINCMISCLFYHLPQCYLFCDLWIFYWISLATWCVNMWFHRNITTFSC